MKKQTSSRSRAIFAAAAAALLLTASLSSFDAAAGWKWGHRDNDREHRSHGGSRATGLVGTVLRETRPFRDVNEATAQGYGIFLGCVSSAHEGAMGVHFVNGGLVGDGMLDATRPEVLVYEPRRRGRLKLAAVEYLVIAEAWHVSNEQPPVLEGQAFNFVGTPNRYGLPAFYELHVWAWKENPHGTFADHNPRVSCERYSPDA